MYLPSAYIALCKLIHLCFFFFRAVVGEVDEEMEAELNLSEIRAEPLNPVVH